MTAGPRMTSGVDPLTPEQRRLNMSRVRGKDTKPELVIRRALHAGGFRYRLHGRKLPGRPDLVFSRRKAVIFVHGCFWHGHDCPMFRLPATRTDFWAAKIEGNRARDQRAVSALLESDWRVATIWECCLRGPARRPLDAVVGQARAFLESQTPVCELAGDWSGLGRGGDQSE